MTEVVDRRGLADGAERAGGSKSEGRAARRKRRGIDPAKVPFSRTVFETERLNSGRLLTELMKVTRARCERGGGGLRFSVPSRDAAKVVAICGSLCYNYKIIKEKGFVLSLVRAARRAGAVLGVLCAAALTAVYPMFVTEVEYSGDELAAVREAVEEYGVKEWALLPAFDGDALERALLAVDGVAFASVTKRGTHVFVDVRTERGNEHFVDVPTGDVTAAVAASVTRVIVWSGTAEVDYGDVVLPGDTLIGAYVLSGEEKVPCPADGEVYGLADRTVTRFFPDTEMVREYGRVHREVRISHTGKVPSVPESPYENYELEISAVRNDFLIGYTLYAYTFREVTVREQTNTRTEEEMKREAESGLVASLPAGAEIVTLSSSVSRGEGGVYVKASVQTEERID